MSRIAKKSIILPNLVTVIKESKFFTVNGSLGTLIVPNFSELTVAINDNQIYFEQDINYKKFSAKAGLLRSLLNNAVYGVMATSKS